MQPLDKYKSKLYKGFEKQIKRQYAKPREVKIKFEKTFLPVNFKGKYKHFMIVQNSIWNGMNLKNLANRLAPKNHASLGMYSKFYIQKNGKYKLSLHGKDLLRKRKKYKQHLKNRNL